MNRKRAGKLPPRYTFLLNPHNFDRLSKCPVCEKLTYPRKFALFIHVDEIGPVTLGKTCKYCSRCEMILCQQDELEAELTAFFERAAPKALGEEYFVVGTLERKTWRSGLEGHEPATLDDLLAHAADFRKYRGLSVRPGGWYADGHEAEPLPAFRPQRIRWPEGFPRR